MRYKYQFKQKKLSKSYGKQSAGGNESKNV